MILITFFVFLLILLFLYKLPMHNMKEIVFMHCKVKLELAYELYDPINLKTLLLTRYWKPSLQPFKTLQQISL